MHDALPVLLIVYLSREKQKRGKKNKLRAIKKSSENVSFGIVTGVIVLFFFNTLKRPKK